MAIGQMSEVVQQIRTTALLQDGAGLTDGQLLGCFIEHRDEAALAALVRRHGPMVWGVCRRTLRHHQDAEDAFQATFLVLVRRAGSVRPREMVANWLYGVARQTALKARGTAGRRGARERQVIPMPVPAAAEPDPGRDLLPLLDEELSLLPDIYRVAIILCDLEGKTRKEAARQLGCPEGTLAARVARGRVMLAKRLARRGVVLSGGLLAAVLARSTASACVPPSVMSAAIKAATAVAAGDAAASVISAKVATLTEGVLKAMLLTKLKVATAVLLVAAVVGLGAGLLRQTQADEPAKEPAKQVQPRNDLDLTKIERKIAKEPAYRGKPRYGLVVLGPKAETRLWLVIDGETLYFDRNGNGDFTEKGEQVEGKHPHAPDHVVFNTGPFVEADGKTKHSDLYVSQYPASQFGHLVNTVGVSDVYGIEGQGQTTNGEDDRAFAESAKDAPIIHFNGPLTLVPYWVWVEYDNGNGKKLKEYSSSTGGLIDFRANTDGGKEVPYELKPGEKVKKLQVKVGTPGLGKGTFAALGVEKVFPKDLHPRAEIVAPSLADASKLVTKEFRLEGRCCGTQFNGAVEVPADAAPGKVSLILSFPDWKEGRVKPGVFELEMVGKPAP